MINLKKLVKRVLLLVTLLLISYLTTTVVRAQTRPTTHSGVPNVLIGKYWQAMDSKSITNKSNHIYFYTTKSLFTIKTPVNGNVRVKWLQYTHFDSCYVLNGFDVKNISRTIWIFVLPKNDWHQAKIGYLNLPSGKVPPYKPAHYAQYNATRISKVTAILY